MQIFALFEPDYAQSIWAAQILSGLQQECAHRKYELRVLDHRCYRELDYNAILPPNNRMVIAAGTSFTWMPDVLTFFTKRQISVIFISYEPPEPSPLRGIVRMDYQDGMHRLIAYLTGCGRRRIALYGVNPNSWADLLKQHCFERGMSGDMTHAVFQNRASLSDCYRAFSARRAAFDAVICANDLAAVSLLNRLKQDGVRVPDDLFLTGFGNSTLLQRVRPTITSVSLDHAEMGRQAVTLYAYLSKQPAGTTASVRVRPHMTVRESTAGIPQDLLRSSPPVRQNERIDFYSDDEVEKWQRIETILGACDELDRAFLAGLLVGESYAALEKRLYLTSSALRYRLKRMMTLSGCQSRAELMNLLFFCRELGLFDLQDGEKPLCERMDAPQSP